MEENRILVVDDNEDLAEAIADLLDIYGYDVDIAFNSTDALKKCSEDNYNMVLMDIMLPDQNGVDSFIKIKKSYPGAKIVVMTGYKDQELINKALENGVNNVFFKPFNIPKLLNIINNS